MLRFWQERAIFAFLILLWSASNIFNVFTRKMDRIWQVEDARTMWQHRGLGILIAMTISLLLLLASFVKGLFQQFLARCCRKSGYCSAP